MGNNTSHTYFDLASEIFPEYISHYGLLGGVGYFNYLTTCTFDGK